MTESPKTFIRRLGLVGFSQTFVSLKGLIYLPILTRNLGASDYGVWALILVTFAVLQPFIILGLNSPILRFLASQKKEKIVQGVITVVIVVLLTGTIASIILFLSSDIIAINILKEPSAAYIIKIAAPFVILDSLNTIILGSFRVFGMIKKLALVSIVKTFLEIGLIMLFILFGFGLIGAILSLMIAAVISLIIMLFFIFSYAGVPRPDFLLLKPYLLFGIPLIPITLAQFVIEISDRYVVGFFMGAEKVGIYSAAYGIGIIPLGLSTYLVFLLGPTVYDLYDKGKIDKVKMYLSYSWKYLLMLSIPSAFGLSILAKSLLLNLTTTKFVSDGIYIIPLVVVSIVFYGMEQIFGVSLWIFKRRRIFFIAFVCAAVTNFTLNIIFVPRYGVIAAAVTTLIAYIILTVITGYSSRRHFSFDLHLRFTMKCIIASIGMTFCIWILNPIHIISIVISIILGIIIYFCLLLLLKGFKKKELQIIFDTVGLKKIYDKIDVSLNQIRK